MKKKYKRGLICSSFELLHPGHIRIMEQAKEICDELYIAFNCHPESGWKQKPVQSIFERFYQISSIKHVDKVIPYESESDLKLLIKMVGHDARILGSDYINKDYTGEEWESDHGVKVIFFDRSHDLSTTELKKRVIKAYEDSSRVEAASAESSTRLEIERKFLTVCSYNHLSSMKPERVEQCYLSIDPEIRIRRSGDTYYHTQKSNGSKIRSEIEREISGEEYNILKRQRVGYVIVKDRYSMNLESGHIAEIDVFKNQLEGLITIEVEFSSEEDSNKFTPPDWFGADITEDPFYKNKNLAKLDTYTHRSNSDR